MFPRNPHNLKRGCRLRELSTISYWDPIESSAPSIQTVIGLRVHRWSDQAGSHVLRFSSQGAELTGCHRGAGSIESIRANRPADDYT